MWIVRKKSVIIIGTEDVLSFDDFHQACLTFWNLSKDILNSAKFGNLGSLADSLHEVLSMWYAACPYTLRDVAAPQYDPFVEKRRYKCLCENEK